ncbi:MAG: O-antigen ligase [Bacteroidales bacterium]|jgi:O-antigen ligase|nr:O-antigen ligase [Bacteroidales bacterium]MDX9797674.1 O-antigen ligase [Bacteroidales bacterium]
MRFLNQIIDYIAKILSPLLSLWGRVNDKAKTIIIISILCALFIGIGYSYIDYEYYIYGVVPIVLLLLLLYYYHLDKVLYLIALITPFSINMLVSETTSMTLPTEPLLIFFTLVFSIKFFVDGKYNPKILTHPITLAIVFYLFWMLITALTSVRPVVSFKYFASKIFYIIPFYLAVIPLLSNFKKIKTIYLFYAISLMFVVFYATIGFAQKGFEFDYCFYIMQPFYNDHTAYGAILAMFLTITTFFIFSKSTSKWGRLLYIFLFGIFLMGLILSYSRAAWLSVLPAVGIFIILKFKIKFKLILITFFSLILLFFAFQSPLLQLLEKNNQDSSGNIAEHITSISNISTDASNVERINRWACAFRMFKEKPFFGWGPGTYQFEYAGYQKSFQLSTISTNAGNLGNAHSEYFGPLTESGVLGMLSVIILFSVVTYTGIKVYKRAQNKAEGQLAIFLTMALVTYYTHGVLNNFLDTDKLSIPFWFFTAAIVALDIYSQKRERI